MLRRLVVDNLTVIDHAELDLGPGLTCITGETGAGKTMLTQAVRLVAGGKAETSLIGARGDEAYAEAEFDDPVPEILADVLGDGDALVLARRLRAGGAKALCGGRSCSADQLREAASELIAITGQNTARQLTNQQVQLDLVDGKGKLETARAEVGGSFLRLRAAEDELDEARQGLSDKVRRSEMLRHDIDLVRALNPQPGERQELETELERLTHAESLRSATASAAHLLGSDDGLSDQLARVGRELEDASEHDKEVAQLAQEIDSMTEGLRDLASTAQNLTEGYDSDPGRLDEVEQRLSAFHDLKRRFAGAEIAEILEQIEASERELEMLETSDERIASLEAAVESARAEYEGLATKLRSGRRKASQKLSKEAEGHLSELGLAEAKLVIEWAEVEPSPSGMDRVQLLLQANSQLQATPLDKGASGGELSRVNLALLLASSAHQGTWIFDEVDAGIGGQTAHVVAGKLKALSSLCQVIAVTHLAQIAVQADHHFVITKNGTATVTEISTAQEKEQELARLMGADSSDEQASQAAAELMRAAAR